MKNKRETKYTLVQHSGYSYGGKPEFQAAVELLAVEGAMIDRVKRAGGVLFDTWKECDEAEQRENYPPEIKGMIPHVRGRFSKVKVDKLAVYLPDPKLGLVRKEEVGA